MTRIARILLIIIAFRMALLLFGCKAKQVSSHTTVVNKDSVDVSKVLERSETFDSIVNTPKVVIEYVVFNPCDSSGKLKDVNQTVVAGKAKSRVYTRANFNGHKELVIESECEGTVERYRNSVATKDRLRKQLVNDYVRQSMTQKTVTNHVPMKYIWWLVAAIAYGVFITYLFVRTVFIKFK